MQSQDKVKTGLEAKSAAVTDPARDKVPALRKPIASPAPKPGRKPWLWALAASLAVAVAALLWLQPWAAKVVTVNVETMAPGPLSRVLAVNGNIASLHPVDVRANVSGSVVSVLKDEGDKVAPGETLATIDAAGQQAAVRQARAALDAGNVAHEQAATDAAHLRALGGIVAATALADADRRARSADQQVRQLTALFDQAEIQLAKYRVTAPIAGVVLTRGIQPGQTADTTTVLFTLQDVSAPVVLTEVDEAYAAQIALGQRAVLQLVGETTTHSGKVSFVSPRVNADTGALVVKITPDQPIIAPVGLTVTANIVVDQQTAALSVPRAALILGTDAPAVLVVDADIAHKRAVTVIDWPASRLIVTDGLKPGEVVIADATGIKDGQTVKIAVK